MMPALLLPAALAGLLALLIPLVIHIARRSEQLPTDFAALRWLRQKPKPRSRLRFDEWLLLALRLALLALVVLWLSHPVLFGAASKQAYVTLAPGLDPVVVNDKALADGRAHWLAPGYPRVEPGKPIMTDAIPLASLVRQLDAELPQGAPLTIIVPQMIQGADAERPHLSRKVDWRIVPGAMPAGKPVPVKVPSIAIRADAGHAAGVRYLNAAALAWQPAGKPGDVDSGPLTAPLPSSDKILFWMSAGSLPEVLQRWIAQGGQAIIASDALLPQGAMPAPLWQDDLARPLVEAMPIGKGRLLRFTRPLQPAQMPQLLEADFPVRLRALIQPPSIAPQRADAAAYAPLTGGRAYPQSPADLRPWLALLIAALLLVERWFATRRKRAIAP
ncbi:MAG: BatA domain-containing protein [Sphingobium yanoikuyae]|uniref:BatA domain-containing protein n=1 Tax=Sphingobium yanoikuyae TaxID=13690 RepID=A0A9X7U763_SPHYA|nr:BatA domain-containing protein [Sphingobium yanoikuyae]MBO9524850.1 BatA domain-containing protein [Sphingobium yanoikuyae]QNG44973.1 BatA domain-containing protein [Sphingobium yanoikuyae]